MSGMSCTWPLYMYMYMNLCPDRGSWLQLHVFNCMCVDNYRGSHAGTAVLA